MNSCPGGSIARCRRRERALARVVAEMPVVVAQDGIHIGVAREQPCIEQRAAMHGIPGAERRIDTIGVLSRAGRQGVVADPAVPALAQDHCARDRAAHRLAKR